MYKKRVYKRSSNAGNRGGSKRGLVPILNLHAGNMFEFPAGRKTYEYYGHFSGDTVVAYCSHSPYKEYYIPYERAKRTYVRLVDM